MEQGGRHAVRTARASLVGRLPGHDSSNSTAYYYDQSRTPILHLCGPEGLKTQQILQGNQGCILCALFCWYDMQARLGHVIAATT